MLFKKRIKKYMMVKHTDESTFMEIINSKYENFNVTNIIYETVIYSVNRFMYIAHIEYIR